MRLQRVRIVVKNGEQFEFVRHAMRPERLARALDRFEPMRTNLKRASYSRGSPSMPVERLSRLNRRRTLSDAERRARDLRQDLTTQEIHPDVLRFCRAELVADDYFHAYWSYKKHP